VFLFSSPEKAASGRLTQEQASGGYYPGPKGTTPGKICIIIPGFTLP